MSDRTCLNCNNLVIKDGFTTCSSGRRCNWFPKIDTTPKQSTPNNKMSTVEQAFEEWWKQLDWEYSDDNYCLSNNSFIAGDANGYKRALEKVREWAVSAKNPYWKEQITPQILTELDKLKGE